MTRIAAALTAAVLALGVAGCGPSPQEAERQAKEQADAAAAKERAEGVAGSEKAVRDYYAETDKYLNAPMPHVPYASRAFREEHNQFVADNKRDGLVSRGASTIKKLETTFYQGYPTWTSGVDVCAVVTGGIYDKAGRNVATDPDGKPVSDKPRQVPIHYMLQRVPEDSRWEITQETVEKGSC